VNAVGNPSSVNLDDFSLAKEGPFFQLLVKTRLMRPDLSPLPRRAVFFALFTWLPLLIFSAWKGLAYGGEIQVPFLFDFTAAVRFLLSLPLLIAAEKVLDSRTREGIGHFLKSGLFPEKELTPFAAAVAKFAELRKSFVAEIVIIGLILLSAFGLRVESSPSISTWQMLLTESGAARTPAGWWYVLVSLPVFQFLMFRWLWRIGLWYWFIWKISRLDLELTATHPDGAAGLGFLSLAQAKFGIIIFAGSAVIAADIGKKIIFGGASLFDYQMLVLGYVLLVLIIFLSPLLVFSPRLFEVKRRGLLEYGALASQYTRLFHRKWVRGETTEGEALMGSADIQSLADLGGSFEIIRKMKPVPIDLNTLIALAGPAIAPMLPLALTVFPLEEILKGILGILF
jgi:hypothetical protein